MNKNLSNLNSLKMGGAFSLQKYLSDKMSLFTNWKIIAAVIVGILLCISAYFMYKQFTNSKSSFHPNRENIPKDTKDANSNKTATLMLFYVDWCPHCKTAKPEWESLKAEYDNKVINGYNLSLVEYNCTNETAETSQLMDKYRIEGYPTIKLVKDNQIIEYDAKPTKSTIEQFLNTVL